MYNFENDIKNRLSDFEYEFKSEYWDNMEQKLNNAGSGSNGSVSKFGKLSGMGSWGNLFIYTGIASLLITSVAIGVNLSNHHNEPKQVIVNVDDTCNDDTFQLAIKDQQQAPVTEMQTGDDMPEVATTHEASPVKSLQNNTDEISMIGEHQLSSPHISSTRLGLVREDKVSIERTIDSSTAEVETQEYQIPDPQHISDDNRTDTTNQKKMRVIVKEEKDKRPMAKPDKRVFGKRKGILYYLGIRR